MSEFAEPAPVNQDSNNNQQQQQQMPDLPDGCDWFNTSSSNGTSTTAGTNNDANTVNNASTVTNFDVGDDFFLDSDATNTNTFGRQSNLQQNNNNVNDASNGFSTDMSFDFDPSNDPFDTTTKSSSASKNNQQQQIPRNSGSGGQNSIVIPSAPNSTPVGADLNKRNNDNDFAAVDFFQQQNQSSSSSAFLADANNISTVTGANPDSQHNNTSANSANKQRDGAPPAVGDDGNSPVHKFSVPAMQHAPRHPNPQQQQQQSASATNTNQKHHNQVDTSNNNNNNNTTNVTPMNVAQALNFDSSSSSAATPCGGARSTAQLANSRGSFSTPARNSNNHQIHLQHSASSAGASAASSAGRPSIVDLQAVENAIKEVKALTKEHSAKCRNSTRRRRRNQEDGVAADEDDDKNKNNADDDDDEEQEDDLHQLLDRSEVWEALEVAHEKAQLARGRLNTSNVALTGELLRLAELLGPHQEINRLTEMAADTPLLEALPRIVEIIEELFAVEEPTFRAEDFVFEFDDVFPPVVSQ